MKKLIYLALATLLCVPALAQNSTYYLVSLRDKGEQTYKPEDILSPRALERRKKQNIEITSADYPVNASYVQAILAQGVSFRSASKWMNMVVVKSNDPSALGRIRGLAFVTGVREITVKSGETTSSNLIPYTRPIVADEELDRSAAALNYGPSYNQANQIGADCMHSQGFMGQGIVIAVLDAGFYNVDVLDAFDSLRMNGQLLGTRDFVTGDTMVYEDYQHGMNVLSCMVGNLPGKIIGTAPKASYWLLRTEDSGSETPLEEINWAVAAEFADSVGADIINSSLGYSYFDDPADNHTFADLDGNTTIVTKAADLAASKGIFVASSAGNSGGAPWYKITAPADADSVLTVGAVDSAGFVAGFSSRGPTADGRIKPDVVAKGVSAVYASDWNDITTGGGTSFSSPITAGAVACLWQANPSATNMQLMDAIRQSASQFSTPDTIAGYGIPNFCVANTILSVGDHPASVHELDVYPNPFKDVFTMEFYSSVKQQLNIDVLDITGRIICSYNMETSAAARQTVRIPFGSSATAGLYIVRVIGSDFMSVKKVIKN